MDVLQRLTEALENSEVVSIIYLGGSQPGTKRDIFPLKISGDRVWAVCTATEQRKCFILSKITLCDNKQPATDYTTANEETNSPIDAFARISDTLTSMCWHVEYDKQSISVFRYFKSHAKHPTLA